MKDIDIHTNEKYFYFLYQNNYLLCSYTDRKSDIETKMDWDLKPMLYELVDKYNGSLITRRTYATQIRVVFHELGDAFKAEPFVKAYLVGQKLRA